MIRARGAHSSAASREVHRGADAGSAGTGLPPRKPRRAFESTLSAPHPLPDSPFATKSWRAARLAARLSRSPELRELVATTEELYILALAGKIAPSLGVVVWDLIQRAGDELKRGHTDNALHLIRAARRLAED